MGNSGLPENNTNAIVKRRMGPDQAETADVNCNRFLSTKVIVGAQMFCK